MVNTLSTARRVPTVHFGEVEITPEQVIAFVTPLPPFIAQREYVLLADPQEEPFQWLQSVEEPALALVVAPYEALIGQPPPPLPHPCRSELGLRRDERSEAYLVVSLGETPADATANLLAPLYVCRRTCRGRQIITGAELDLVRVPLFS